MFEVALVTALAFTTLFWSLRISKSQLSVKLLTRIGSLIHASVQTVLGIVCSFEALGYLSVPPLTHRTMVWGVNPWAIFAGEIFFGFIVYDLIHCLLIRDLFKFDDIIHHTLFCGVSYLGISRGFLQLAFLWLILGEVSTIFLNINWMLYKAGWEQSTVYTLNGLTLFVTFIAFRVVLFGVGLSYLFNHLLPYVQEADNPIMRWTPYLLVGAYALNICWATMLAKKVYDGLCGKKGKDSKE